jgi:hypothetical protein
VAENSTPSFVLMEMISSLEDSLLTLIQYVYGYSILLSTGKGYWIVWVTAFSEELTNK